MSKYRDNLENKYKAKYKMNAKYGNYKNKLLCTSLLKKAACQCCSCHSNRIGFYEDLLPLGL